MGVIKDRFLSMPTDDELVVPTDGVVVTVDPPNNTLAPGVAASEPWWIGAMQIFLFAGTAVSFVSAFGFGVNCTKEFRSLLLDAGVRATRMLLLCLDDEHDNGNAGSAAESEPCELLLVEEGGRVEGGGAMKNFSYQSSLESSDLLFLACPFTQRSKSPPAW